MHSTVSTALLISPYEEDHTFLRGLFTENGWTLDSADCLQAALDRDLLPPVLITEASLPAGTWRSVLGCIGLLPQPPLLIVIALHADERLWAEALNLGAYDVLAKPFHKEEVRRVLHGAWRRREESGRRAKGVGA